MKNSKGRDPVEAKKKGIYLGFVRTAAQETQLQEVLELCSAGLQNGGRL